MLAEDSSTYLRFSQFLDLESHWTGACDSAEVCHRICRTAGLLLGTPAVAIGLSRNGDGYRVLAADGKWGDVEEGDPMATALVRSARTNGTPQLKSIGQSSVGVFPFSGVGGSIGCVHVRIDRPLFRGAEIAFLRFIASIVGLALGGGHDNPPAQAHSTPDADAAATTAARLDARRYVAMAVHDLRNPLNVVSGYAALLADESLGALSGEQREAVAAIERQVDTLLSAIDQLIDLDRVAHGNAPGARDEFDLRALFDELAAICFRHCDGRVQWPGPEAAFAVVTDRRRVFSIVQNLVDNALKHTQSERVVVDCTRRDGQLVIEIADRGPGIDPEIRTRLAAQAAGDGTDAPRAGLGLYSVASHVRVLHGSLAIEDREGGGTRIITRVPLDTSKG